MMEKKLGRRSFLKLGLAAVAAIPFLKSANALAGQCPNTSPAVKNAVDPASPAASRLEFVCNASESKNKLFKAGSNCGNCAFYKADKAANGAAPCTMLAMKAVPETGWCKSYKKKA